MSLFLEATRPVLFELENSEYPYFGLGSSVLISTENHFYWATARHVVENQDQNADSLRIYPSEASRQSLPFDELITINREADDPDFSDLYILKIDLDMYKTSGDAEVIAQRLEDGFFYPKNLSKGEELIIVGFPEEGRAVDYEDFKIKYQRSIFVAYYDTEAPMAHCYKIIFRGDHGLATFNSLSGSPVYKMVTVGNLILPKLVGVLLRGTASSNSAFIVSSEVLAYAIQKAEEK